MLEVTKDGKVYLNGVEKKQSNHPCGYKRITHNKKKFYVHRLVAQKYIPNPNNLPEVNHINGIKTDNRVENLEWVTSSGNKIHALTTGLRFNEVKMKRHLTDEQVFEIRKKYQFRTYTQIMLANEYNVTRSVIYNIINNKSYKNNIHYYGRL
jgi:hypothetical protein